jgi:hypothetical protein
VSFATPPDPGDDQLGPVNFFAIEFPDGRLTAAGFEALLALADQGLVEILDMEFIAEDAESRGGGDLRESLGARTSSTMPS